MIILHLKDNRDLSGGDAFIEMRNINPGIKAILSSGFSLNGEAQKMIKEGIIGFIKKPYKKIELEKKIIDALKQD